MVILKKIINIFWELGKEIGENKALYCFFIIFLFITVRFQESYMK